jgi:anti-anti-sigma factor
MAKLELKSAPAAEAPEVQVLALEGDLHLATLHQLEAMLEEYRLAKRLKVVVDLGGLNFINSSGLGAFLSTVEHFRQGGGDLAFVRLSPKVSKIFTMLGFDQVLTVLPGQAEALEHFASGGRRSKPSHFVLAKSQAEPHSGEPFVLAVQATDSHGRAAKAYAGTAKLMPQWGVVSPAQIGPFVEGQWTGAVTMTGPGKLELQVADGELKGELTLELMESKIPAQFPKNVACPGCRQVTSASGSSVQRCRRCQEIYLVDRWAHAISLRRGGEGLRPSRVFQMLVPSDVNVLGNLRTFVTSTLLGEAFEEAFVNDVELAVDEALSNVIEHAYAYDPGQTIALKLSVDDEGVEVVLKDKGKPLDAASLQPLDLKNHLKLRRPGGLGRHLIEAFMDKVEQERHGDGNVLRMSKKRQA